MRKAPRATAGRHPNALSGSAAADRTRVPRAVKKNAAAEIESRLKRSDYSRSSKPSTWNGLTRRLGAHAVSAARAQGEWSASSAGIGGLNGRISFS